jgi:hypothetical protein
MDLLFLQSDKFEEMLRSLLPQERFNFLLGNGIEFARY